MRLLPFIAVFATVLVAQDRYPVESLHVRGNAAIPEARILSASGLKVGDKAARPDFVAARDRLLETGAFDNVGFEYKSSQSRSGYDVTFSVIETQPLYHFRFEELPAPDADLRAALRQQEPIFTDAIPETPQVLNRYATALARYLNEHGASGIQVAGESNSDNPQETMIVFHPRGERRVISSIDFTGNQALSQEDLRRIVQGTAIGVRYSEPLFRTLLDNGVRAAYENKGFLRVAFTNFTTRLSSTDEGVIVNVTVEEGSPFTLGEVSYTGVDPKKEASLNKLAKWTKDAPINFSDVETALVGIRKTFAQDGYLRATTKPERVIHDDTHLVDLKVAVDLGPQYRMGKLTFAGLNILSEPQMRKLWKLKAGAPFRESYPDDFVKMIQDEDYFENLKKIGVQTDLRDDLSADVTLTFEGGHAVPEDQRKPRP